MIAAAVPQSSERRSLFRLALEIIATHDRLPQELLDETNSIFRTGLELATNHSPVTSATNDEAIRLAVQLRTDAELLEKVRTADNILSLNEETVVAILEGSGNKVAQFI